MESMHERFILDIESARIKADQPYAENLARPQSSLKMKRLPQQMTGSLHEKKSSCKKL